MFVPQHANLCTKQPSASHRRVSEIVHAGWPMADRTPSPQEAPPFLTTKLFCFRPKLSYLACVGESCGQRTCSAPTTREAAVAHRSPVDMRSVLANASLPVSHATAAGQTFSLLPAATGRRSHRSYFSTQGLHPELDKTFTRLGATDFPRPRRAK